MNAEDISDSDVWVAAGGCLGAVLLLGVLRGARPNLASFEEPLTTRARKRGTPSSVGESVLTGSPRRASVETLRSLTSPSAQDRFHGAPSRSCCGVPITENMRVLALTAALFAVITIAQFIAARIARSDALLADCVSMAVDALTYLLNIFVEVREGKLFHRELQLVVPSISLSVLFYFTVAMLLEAKETLSSHTGAEADEDEVNPTIILGFAVLGIVFDAIALRAFLQDADKGSMNMFAALAHVGADFARSTVTFAAAILIMNGHDGARTDAWACVIVTGLILGGILFAVYELAKEIRTYRRDQGLTSSFEGAPSFARDGQIRLELPSSPPPPFKEG